MPLILALGFIKFEEIPNLVDIEREFTPVSEHAEVYGNKFKKFLSLWKLTRQISSN